MGNGPCVLMDVLTPPLLVAPLPLTFWLPLAKLMLGVVFAPLGAIILLAIET